MVGFGPPPAVGFPGALRSVNDCERRTASVLAAGRARQRPFGRPGGAGLRFARAGRFEPPELITVYPEPQEAVERSPLPPQLPSEVLARLVGLDDLGSAEDCLRLSITLLDGLAEDERLPVLVWIHGGSYVTGGGDLHVYDPARLVAEQRVIVVAITYRLGLLGFLGDGTTVPANLGLLDQLAALRWIHDNIAAFGGEPDQVTLFGQSAGADAIAHLMISAGARGLSRRVIMQSAPLGITTGWAAMSAAMITAIGAWPRTAPVDEVLATQALAQRAAGSFGLAGGMPFGVQYGFAPVPAEADSDAAWRAVAGEIDVLIGCTTEEAAMLAGALPVAARLFAVPGLGPLTRTLTTTPFTRIYDTPARRFVARHLAAGGRLPIPDPLAATLQPVRGGAYHRPATAARQPGGRVGRPPHSAPNARSDRRSRAATGRRSRPASADCWSAARWPARPAAGRSGPPG